MKARTVLGAALGTVGGVVLGNRLLKRRASDLENPLVGIERTYRWRGIETTYTVAGDPNDPDMLLLHGVYAARAATSSSRSSNDWPRTTTSTRSTSRVRSLGAAAPGLLRSPLRRIRARLRGRDHRRADRRRLVAVRDVRRRRRRRDRTRASRPDLSGRRDDRRAAVGPDAPANADRGHDAVQPAREQTLDPVLLRPGRLLRRRPDQRRGSRLRLGQRPPVRRALRPGLLRRGCLDPDFDLATELAALEIPTTLVWGRDAELVPLREGRNLAEAADLDLVVVDYATQLPHAEHPDTFVEYLSAELPRADAGSSK